MLLFRTLLTFAALLSPLHTTSALSAETSPSESIRRIGMLGVGSKQNYAEPMQAFRSRLEELGWNRGRIVFVERWADRNAEDLPRLAGELVELRVDLVVAIGRLSSETTPRLIRGIPVLFPGAWDPVGDKIVASLARPGGNTTGLSFMASEMYAKELSLLKEALPNLRKVGVLVDRHFANQLKAMQATSRNLGIELETAEIEPLNDLDVRLQRLIDDGVQAFAGILNLDHAVLEKCIRFGLTHRIPLADYTDAPPGLLSLEIDEIDMYRRAAEYADKILRGANPGDLPIEQPTRFRLFINLQTAQLFGLVLPQALLLRADQVIR
jgi:putative ABC transport system substrate-binding protein